jgi:murein DD-endopeptidase MepM/ murein hydrolase activator NlpD
MTFAARVTLGFLLIGTLATAVTALSLASPPRPLTPAPATAAPPPVPDGLYAAAGPVTETVSLKPGDTLADLLAGAGINADARQQVIAAASQAYNLRSLRAGAQITVTLNGISGDVLSLEYVIDPDHRLAVSPHGDSYQAALVDVPGTLRQLPVCATLDDSLSVSVHNTGLPSDLALQIADIFSWDLDFYTDPQPGDQFCVLVQEKDYANGQSPTYQNILAAQYRNAGTLYDAYLFPDKDGNTRYFSHQGHALQAAFLRSPLKFQSRISSHFSRHRFHPILKRFRPHLGTDYAAPTGTPVQAIAAGKVVFSGYSGGSGNLITIQHQGGYLTQYMHLSRRLVQSGQHVDQGARIGLVGASGLATGPHLDFRMRQNGRYVDFEHLRLPRSTAVTPRRMATFTELRDRYDALLATATHSSDAVASAAN